MKKINSTLTVFAFVWLWHDFYSGSNAGSTKSVRFRQVSNASYAERTCTCGSSKKASKVNEARQETPSHIFHTNFYQEHSNLQRESNTCNCTNPWNIPPPKNRRRRYYRCEKCSKRESHRPRNCFTRFCICMLGRTLNEVCECTSFHEILPDHHERYSVKVNLQ